MKGGEKIDFEKLAKEANVNLLMRQVQDSLAMLPMIAKMNKTYYDSLLAEGFSKDEALILVGSHGYNLHGGGSK